MRRKLLNEVRLHSIRRTAHIGEFCHAVARAPAHTRRTAASWGSVWKRTRNQFSEPRTGFRTYLLLHHLISHVSSPFSPLPRPHCSLVSLFLCTIPYYTIDSRASLHNGRVIPLMHRPWAALPYAVLTYNNKRDGHCTFLQSVLPFSHGRRVSFYNTISGTLPGACSTTTITCK
jgi:hypothetical protein